MSLKPIPSVWRAKVCAILRQGDPRLIDYTKDCLRTRQDEFPAVFEYEMEEALANALSARDVYGCEVPMDHPSGTTWEFYFPFCNHKLYGKILLRPDLKRIVVFSTHHPTKPTLRCE